METYKHALLKFTTNPFKSNLELKNLQNDAFIGMLKDFLNDADIHYLLENILELTINDSSKADSASWLDHTHKMTYVNKIYKNSSEKRSTEDTVLIKSAILSALECSDIIFEMIHTQITLEKKTEREKHAFVHQHHLSHLSIVQYIKEALLNSSSFVADLDDNKLLLTIAAYIHFETRYACPRDSRVSPIDDHLSGVVNYDEYLNVSSIALKCMTQVVKIWELLPVSKVPSLTSYLAYDGNNFMHAHVILEKSLVNPEEAYTFLEFLI